MKAHIRRLGIVQLGIMACLLVLAGALPVQAQTTAQPYSSYTIGNDGRIIPIPDPYVLDHVIDGVALGIGATCPRRKTSSPTARLTTSTSPTRGTIGSSSWTRKKESSRILEAEIALFPKVRAFLLMGDVAIKRINYKAKRAGDERVIPSGSTYKLRGGEYFFRGRRAFPSYVQASPSFFIEKIKRRMIAEDIAGALEWAR